MVQAWVAHFVTPLKCISMTSMTDVSRVRNHTKITNHLTNTITMVLEPLTFQRRGFDEPMPPEGWKALHMFALMPPSKRFNRFKKLM